MRAVVVATPGDASQLAVGTVDTPTPGQNEILVKVKTRACSALNRLDILQREGKYPPPAGASPILGVEFAGTVEAFGEHAAQKYTKGDRVFGLVPGGAYAEYCVIHMDMAMPIPASLTFQQAAAIPEVWLTAYQALHWNCNIQKGESVLIHAGASGVGTAAIQLAARMEAKHIIVTVGSDEKGEFCKALGATAAINRKSTTTFDKAVLEHTNNRGVDVVVDFIGGNYWDANLASMAVDGRMVMLAMLGGESDKPKGFSTILRKRLTIRGSTLRSRSTDYQIKLTGEFAKEILPIVVEGRLKPIIDKEFSWHDIQAAHRLLESNSTIGKIVVNLD
ncbi:NADPH:quinone reductase [Zopfochytrium polystomum]|nr:NADPH:quinone reductase [Zopfochytrium polystomum]